MFSFVKSRPPLVIVLCCLVTITITFFCFAYYIKHTDPVPDSDKNNDWLQMLKHFDNLKYCIKHDEPKVEKTARNNEISVETLISVNIEAFRKLNFVRGALTLDGWYPNCKKNHDLSNLEIFFNIPQLAKTNVTKFDICVSISGPEEYLPTFLKPNCNISTGTEEKSNKVQGFLDSMKSTKLNKTFCKNGTLTKFEFHPQEKDNFANYLTVEEKDIIYVRILWTTVILLFFILMIIIYGTFQTEKNYNYQKIRT